MTRLLVTIGIILIVVGLAWPWLAKLGLGRLPGDIVIEHENFAAQGSANAARGRMPGAARFYFPNTTMVVISVVLSLIFWLFRK